MGWDAYATKYGHPIKKNWDKKGQIVDPKIRRVFAKAAKLGDYCSQECKNKANA